MTIIYALDLHSTQWSGFVTTLQYKENLLAAKLMSPRIRWGTSLFVFFLAFIALSATSILVIWRSLDAWQRPLRFCAVAGLLLVALLVCGLIKLQYTSIPLIIKLIESNLNDCTDVIIYATWSGVTSVILTVGAACFILFSPRQRDEDRIGHMIRQTMELRILLYIASLMLVAGIFEIKTLFSYLTTMVLPEDTSDKLNILLTAAVEAEMFKQVSGQVAIIREVADATKTAAGCVFTALLAGMYLPAALVLDKRMTAVSERLARAAAAAQGLAVAAPSPPQPPPKVVIPQVLTQMMNLVAALAPLVLGTSLDLLGKLGSLG